MYTHIYSADTVLQALSWGVINLFKHDVGIDGEGLVIENLQGLLDQTALLSFQNYMNEWLVRGKINRRQRGSPKGVIIDFVCS